MKTIKEVLNQNHPKKTKVELAEMMTNLEAILSPEEYEKISAVKPTQLTSLTKSEILDVIEDFQSNYDPNWESLASNSPEAFTDLVKGMADLVAQDQTNFRVQSAANAGFTAELANTDFENLIAGPLSACVTAQNKASLATVNFIKEVGLKEVTRGIETNTEVVMVKFKCKKTQLNPYYGKTAGEDGVPEDANVSDEYLDPKDIHVDIPLISIINIPSIRIETCEVDFNVKLNSVYTKDVSSRLGIDARASARWGPVKFKVSTSYRRTSSTGVKVEKEYNMGVKVKAVNDQLPGGLEQVLGILAE